MRCNGHVALESKSASYRRQDDSLRGRHLTAVRRIQKDELIFCERPLCSLQSLGNVHQGALVCRACRAFCGGPSVCLKLASGSLNREDVFNEEPSLVPCRQKCGEVYCTVECEQDFWKCHSLICTGAIKDDSHPLLEWKRHAIVNNEIFLLVGDVLSAILVYPELKGVYTDFTMVPWWTVATLPFVDKPLGFSESSVLDSSCRTLCEESADLFNQALQLHGVETELITPLFIAQIIGAFEQNSIGIRARHPLCREIVENGELRSRQLQDVVRCLEKANFIGEDDACEDEVCGDDAQGEGDNGSEMTEEESEDDVGGGEMNVENQGNYTPDEIAGLLASLDIDEREGDDDLGALFAPLDGTAMFSTTCKMNHSCNPNVVVVYRGLKWNEPLVAQCIATRDIEPGEELCISYVDVNQPVEARGRELANYGFECSCEKCYAERNETFCDDETANYTSDAEMSVENDDIAYEENDDELEDTTRGEQALRERLEELQSVADLSPYASIPTDIFSEAQYFVVKLGSTALASLDQSSEIADDLLSCLAAAKLSHFGACSSTGSKLENQLSKLVESNGLWPGVVYQDVFFVAAVVASLGFAHSGRFLMAQALLDKATTLGLKRHLIESFFDFVELHSNEMHRGVLVAASVLCEGPAVSSAVQGLSKPIRFGVPEFPGTVGASSSTSKANAFILRGYACHWDAVSLWRSLSWFASMHGNRLLPIKASALGNCDTNLTLMTMRSFVSTVLVPSCGHRTWSLQDSLSRPSAYVADHHLLLHQIPELWQFVEVAPVLCGEGGPSNTNLWMRSGGTRACLKRDAQNCLIVQIVGVFYLRLYTEGERSEMNDTAGEKNSAENCEVEDSARHPQARDAIYQEALLFPGDSLFIPFDKWVYSRSLTANISVAYQW